MFPVHGPVPHVQAAGKERRAGGSSRAASRVRRTCAVSTTASSTELASEIRDELIRTCAPRGGHLGPNLGVVELTMAIHRVFESPRDRVVFDTGHQAYVHKMLTGRAGQFDTLRTEGGLSGYPSQAESEHDVVENSHASTSLSYADGLAKAYAIRGEDRHVVAVIGDGALTGGMAWEALNNIAEGDDRAPGDRRQRQRPLLHADRRRAGQPPHHPAHQPALRADPRPGQAPAQRRARRRPGGLRRPARHEEGHEGRPRAAGPVRGPRAEVRRPDRRPRPRRRRAGADPGQAASAAR